MDAIDNSAGVDCSDHEVNIKILLDTIVADGDLTGKQRNAILAEMARRGRRARPARQLRADAGDLELDGAGGVDGRGARALRPEPRAGRHAEPRAGVPAERRRIRRAPGGRRRADRARSSQPCSRTPRSRSPRSCWPPTCRRIRTSRASSSATSRRACARSSARSSSATRCGGRSSRHGSPTTSSTAPGRPSPSGSATRPAPAPTTSRARTPSPARRSGCAASGSEIEALDGARSRGDADRDAAEGAHPARARDALAPAQPAPADRHRGDGFARYAPGAAVLAEALPALLGPSELEAARAKAAATRGRRRSARARAARRAARGARADARARRDRGRDRLDVAAAAAVYFALGARLELHWLRDRIVDLPRETRWEAMARAALRDDVYSEQAGLTAEVLRAGAGVERWLAENASAVERSLQVLADIRTRRHARPRSAVGRGARDAQPDPLERRARAGRSTRRPRASCATRSRSPRGRARASRSRPRCRARRARL